MMVGKIPRAQLTGLAEEWERNEAVRRRCLCEGKLLQWSSPSVTGVPTLAHAKLNCEILGPFFHTWANACTKPRTPSLEAVKKQATYVLGHGRHVSMRAGRMAGTLNSCTP